MLELQLYESDSKTLIDATYEMSQATLVRTVNQVGAAEIKLPGFDWYDKITPDRFLQFYRNGRLLGDTHWIIEDREKVKEAGKKYTMCYAKDLNLLLERREIPFQDAAYYLRSGVAESIMKAYVSQNLVYDYSLYWEDRSILSGTVSVEPVAGIGPYMTISASRANLLSVLQDISATAYSTDGTYLAFEIIPNGPGLYSFKTYGVARGKDRRYNSPYPFILYDRVHFDDFRVKDETFNSASRIMVISGTGPTKDVSDKTREKGKFARRETTAFVNNINSSTELLDAGNAALRQHRPRTIVNAVLNETPQLIFGQDINYGDAFGVNIEGQLYNVRFDTFKYTLNEKGLEQINMIARSDD